MTVRNHLAMQDMGVMRLDDQQQNGDIEPTKGTKEAPDADQKKNTLKPKGQIIDSQNFDDKNNKTRKSVRAKRQKR